MSPVVPIAARRRHETPAGVMTTLASPTLGATTRLSLWEVAMAAGASGPLHIIDSEQIWTVFEGEIAITVGERREVLRPGDTLAVAGGVGRQIHATTDARLLVCGNGDAVASVPGQPTPLGTPPWIA